MTWHEALWWLPVAALLAMTVLALLAVAAQPARPAKRLWFAAAVASGVLLAVAVARQQAADLAALRQETERLRELSARIDEFGNMLPGGPGTTPAETFDTASAALRTLHGRIAELDTQLRALQEKSRSRAIEPQTATKVAQYLRQFPPQRVVVSCVPDDVEAFGYANQLATMLRDGGWEVLGPGKTAILGEAPTMAVKLFARGGVPPEAARILVDAFARYNIPYQSGVASNDAIPDPAMLELFVSRKS